MEEHRADMKPSEPTVASSIAPILENTCWTVIGPWRECDFYLLFFFPWATHSVVFLHWAITDLVKTQHPVVTWGMYCVKALQTSGFCFSSSSAFSAYLWFYLYILLLSLLIPLAVTTASRTNEGDRALHILPWTPGQVPQQRTQFLWAACVHCWSDILH